MTPARIRFGVGLLAASLLVGEVSAQGLPAISVEGRVRDFVQAGLAAQKAAAESKSPQTVQTNLLKAIDSYRAATELEPDLFQAHYYWGVCLSQLGGVSTNAAQMQLLLHQAEGHLALASHHPDATAEVFEQYGYLLVSKTVNLQPSAAGRKAVLDKAELVLREGIKRSRFKGDTARLETQLGLGQVLLAVSSENKDYQRARYKEAIELFTSASAVKAMEDNAQMYGSWGVALLKLGQMTKDRMLIRAAGERFQSALDKEPSQTEYRYNLACVYAQLDQPDLAMKHLNACLKDDPKGLFRSTARQDPDLEKLRYTAEYKEVFGGNDSSSTMGSPRISN